MVLTQEEPLFLPESVAALCSKRSKDIVGVFGFSPLNSFGGRVRMAWRYASLFGIEMPKLIDRIVRARIRDRVSSPGAGGTVSSVRGAAEACGVPYSTVSTLADEALQHAIERHGPNTLISMSCPVIIPRSFRSQFDLACLNLHGSPLPRYRGLMPGFWVLRNGETTTAATVHELVDALDDGDILGQRPVEISDDDTWFELVRRTKQAGVKELLAVLDRIESGAVTRVPNEASEGSYYSFPTLADRKEFRARGRSFF